MPKKTINDYTFYKIVNINGDVDLCYVGSTVNMIERVRCHKNNCNNPNGAKYNLKVYKTIRQHGGWGEFKMMPIGYAEQLTLTEAHVIEEKYRVELCADLNSFVCHLTQEQRKERNKLNKREWGQINKEAISKKKKVYAENNKDKIKTRIREKITCECGCEIGRGSVARHRRSKKHIDLMNNKNNIEVIHNE